MRNNKKRKFAVFDIDGTIFRSSLLIEITEMCISNGLFPKSSRKVYTRAHLNWLNRKDTYQKYIDRVVRAFAVNIKGVSRDKYLKVVKKVIDLHKNRTYKFTRDLIKDLKKKGYHLIAISNSPKEGVDSFAHSLGFNKIYGSIYEVDFNNEFTGEVLFFDFLSNKSTALMRAVNEEKLSLKGSIGVGDTENDISFLKLVEKPIAFNPNNKLYSHAKKHKWRVVVERKDVIYNV